MFSYSVLNKLRSLNAITKLYKPTGQFKQLSRHKQTTSQLINTPNNNILTTGVNNTIPININVLEEKNNYLIDLEDGDNVPDPFDNINLQRGLTGVFDIEDLVEVLQKENSDDIFVASVPPSNNYVNFICIVTGKSYRHMFAIAQFVRQVYKRKRNDNDLVPMLEGKESRDWMAIDLGNIALHIFSRAARSKYDLDSLWSVGKELDPEYNKQDPIVDMLERHSVYLGDLKPSI